MNKKCFSAVVVLLMTAFTFHGFSQEFQGFSKTPTGLYYKLYKTGKDTLKPRIGDYVEFNMIYHGKARGKDSVFFDSRTQKSGATVKFFLPPPSFQGDLNEGIPMMVVGDSAVFAVNADSLFFKAFKMKKRPAEIDSNQYFYFHLQLLSLRTEEQMIFQEEKDIKKYVEDNKIQERPNSMGLYIIESVKGEGRKVDSGCQVKMNYRVSLLDGKELFSSFERPDPVMCTYGQPIDRPGFEFGLGTLKMGSKAKLIVPSSLAFGKRGKGTIVEPYTALVYDVEILDVKTKAEAEQEQTELNKAEKMKTDSIMNAEAGLLAKYLKEKNIKAKPLPSGLYYIPVTEGTGPKAEAGKTVKVHYTGKLLDGKVFDSSVERNSPIEFVLGQGQVIKGWDQGISMMKQGGKATLIIPSAIGYSDRDMGVIPPYSTLVFEVELVEVK
ncbi:MAG: FKBP-type peptidyl-prolyl cis-trans isomerase [Bacteroidetes bacterium]|nr:FKBP-type peptidyl-prolyl cis-trans isomerase [Bacteroidota bacterium]